MEMVDYVRSISIGNSVAEYDDALDKYFVETEAFRALIEGRVDVVAGDKGTGKTALYRMVTSRHRQLPELKTIEILTAFNPTGSPVFQKLTQDKPLTEGQYKSIWKVYILSLVGNWVLSIADGEGSNKFAKLDSILRDSGLRLESDSPATVFGKLANLVKRFLHPDSVESSLTFSETGVPIFTQKYEYNDKKKGQEQEVSHEEALHVCNECVKELGVTVWFTLDRLDEAFQGYPDIEVPALRALLRTYLDLLEFSNIKIKLFVRCDLFRKIIGDGFVNLTHINAKKTEIVWDEDDLLNLLCERLKESPKLITSLKLSDSNNETIFNRVFPEQVDVGDRKPTCWNWIMSRIRDGNNIKPPRNLIDLVSLAREAQLRREGREPRPYSADHPIFESDAIRRALSKLSQTRVEDTLMAEAGESVALIYKFEGQKSEHNIESLSALLGRDGDRLTLAVKQLEEIGFLEKFGQSYKVPMLYREGLSIIQGKAFNV